VDRKKKGSETSRTTTALTKFFWRMRKMSNPNMKTTFVRKIYRSKCGNVYLAVGRIIPKQWKIVKMEVEEEEDNSITIKLQKLD